MNKKFLKIFQISCPIKGKYFAQLELMANLLKIQKVKNNTNIHQQKNINCDILLRVIHTVDIHYSLGES